MFVIVMTRMRNAEHEPLCAKEQAPGSASKPNLTADCSQEESQSILQAASLSGRTPEENNPSTSLSFKPVLTSSYLLTFEGDQCSAAAR
jgi:hypothetical protein